jgi:predicted ester cyclase
MLYRADPGVDIRVKFAEYVAEDVVFQPPKYQPQMFEGLDGVVTYFSKFASNFDNLKLRVISQIHSERESWIHLDVEGIMIGNFYGLRGNEKPLNFEAIIVYEWDEDTKVKEIRSLNDSLTIFQQLGRAIVEEDNKSKVSNYLDQLRELGMLPQNM